MSRPPVERTPSALVMVTAGILVLAVIAVLVLAHRAATPKPPPGANSSPSPVSTPSEAGPTPSPTPTPGPTPGVLVAPPGRIPLPAFAQLSAPTADVVWALVVDQYLYRSTDGGQTWEQRPMPPLIELPPHVTFINDLEGWLLTTGSPETQCNAEDAYIWHTVDAGATWVPLGSNGVDSAQCKNSVSFVDAGRGFLDAWDPNHAPVIYKTGDGGFTWAPSEPLPDPPGWTTQAGGSTLTAGPVRAFGDTLLVTATGSQAGARHQYVFQSTDGGSTWTYLGAASNAGGQLAIVTASRWLQLIGPGQTLETTNAGTTWHIYASDYGQAAPIAPDVLFADANVGYVTVRGTIGRTSDGGLHWVALHTPGT